MGGERPAGARGGSRLFRDLGGRRHRASRCRGRRRRSLALKFVAHHLWDPSKRVSDLRHGMPAESRRKPAGGGIAALEWPPWPNTVKRRLARWSTLHRWKGIEGPFATPSLRSALRLAA